MHRLGFYPYLHPYFITGTWGRRVAVGLGWCINKGGATSLRNCEQVLLEPVPVVNGDRGLFGSPLPILRLSRLAESDSPLGGTLRGTCSLLHSDTVFPKRSEQRQRTHAPKLPAKRPHQTRKPRLCVVTPLTFTLLETLVFSGQTVRPAGL